MDSLEHQLQWFCDYTQMPELLCVTLKLYSHLGDALSNPAIISLAMADTTLKYSSGNSTSPSKTFCIVSPSSSPRNGDAPLNLHNIIYHTFPNNEQEFNTVNSQDVCHYTNRPVGSVKTSLIGIDSSYKNCLWLTHGICINQSLVYKTSHNNTMWFSYHCRQAF